MIIRISQTVVSDYYSSPSHFPLGGGGLVFSGLGHLSGESTAYTKDKRAAPFYVHSPHSSTRSRSYVSPVVFHFMTGISLNLSYPPGPMVTEPRDPVSIFAVQIDRFGGIGFDVEVPISIA